MGYHQLTGSDAPIWILLLAAGYLKYASVLMARGIAKDRIHAYGLAFLGKQVLIGVG